MNKVLSVVGARPQFVKLSPFSQKIRESFTEIIVHTGQHYDFEMSEKFFMDLRIPSPDYNLGVNQGNHGEQTGKMLMALEKVVISENPDLMVAFGDTNSTLAACLVGSKLNIPVIHIEAGLRSFNRTMPEEINRVVADHIADTLFAPTTTAMSNLTNENLGSRSYLSGDIMVDTLEKAKKQITNLEKSKDVLTTYGIEPGNYCLLTLHRPSNVDYPSVLKQIFSELGELSKKVIFPIHPRTKEVVEKNNLILPNNIQIIRPVGYLDFIALQENSQKVITDSGGIQKEAFLLRKPCVTLRTETEWLGTVNAGWNMLINPHSERGYARKIEDFSPPNYQPKLFGHNVSENMLKLIKDIYL